jgi:hypothetical protein
MKPPDHPTQRTDAALLSSDCACNCGHTFKLLVEEKHDQGKCVHTGPDIANGNDGVVVLADFARTLERELAAARSERDLNITRVASILWSGAIDKQTCGDVQKWADDYTAELARLRAEVERLTKQSKDDNRSYGCELRDPNGTIWQQATKDHARAEKAEAELADWSVLKGWGGTPEIVYKFIKGQQNRIHHCQDLEAELDSERARLDYLALQMGTPRVADALNCDYSKCFPIRDAIDLAMKNESNP